jgi:hypothetical protein
MNEFWLPGHGLDGLFMEIEAVDPHRQTAQLDEHVWAVRPCAYRS